MSTKKTIAKLILGSDIYEDLSSSEKEACKAKDKYESVNSENRTLEKECWCLDRSVKTLSNELISLQKKKKTLDYTIEQLLIGINKEEADTILSNELETKKKELVFLKNELCSLETEHLNLKGKIKGLNEKKISAENRLTELIKEAELLKESFDKEKELRESDAKQANEKLPQRMILRDNLATLKNEWGKKLDEFAAKLDDANKPTLLGLKRELEDYEKKIQNAIDIPVE